MLKRIFQILGVVGFITIYVLAFIVPTNPNEITPALSVISFDKPLWLCIIIGGGFIYLIILYSIYDIINNRLYNNK